MPRSNSAWTNARAWSSPPPPPYVSHEPRLISDTWRSQSPSRLYLMGAIVPKPVHLPSGGRSTVSVLMSSRPAAVQHVCSGCGTSSGRWLGRCPGCGEFGTMHAEAAPARSARSVQVAARPLLRLVDVVSEESERIRTGVPELDRVLGGGLVPASVVLVRGEPGVGKSTLLLSALGAMSQGRRALLVTGEESVAQVKLRAARLGGCDTVEILAETELESVCATLQRERPDGCVGDSIQTRYSSGLGSAPGSVAQLPESAARLLRTAKECG